MKYLSVCSGIEAATVAWESLGRCPADRWKPVGFAEIDAFPSAVLKYHYPDVPNFGDFTKITKEDTGEFDLLVGGTPCQDFSIAGKQSGWDGTRGSLTYEYVRLLSRTMPTWFVWENVPACLCGDLKEGFVEFIKQLSKLGYDVGWRVLDAQYVRVDGFEKAVPQRRRRVFVVGCLRKGCVREVLFKPESSEWDTQESREEGQSTSQDATDSIVRYSPEVSGTILANCGTKHWQGNQEAFSGDFHIVEESSSECLVLAHGQANAEINDNLCPTLNCNHEQPIIAISGNIIGRKLEHGGNHDEYDESGASYTLTTADRHAVCYSFDSLASNSMKSSNPNSGCRSVDVAKTIDTSNQCPSKNQGGIVVCYENHAQDSRIKEIEVSPAIPAKAGTGGGNLPLVQSALQVRRLTPVECERLQGFPDNYTQIPYRGKEKEDCPDSPRYKALGNSMPVNVMRLIGKRIDEYGYR